MAFNQFPYTNFHELNTDWLIAMCKEIMKEVSDIDDKAQKAIDDARSAQYVMFPDLEGKDNWTIYRKLDNVTTGIEFDKTAPYAKIIHNNTRYGILSTANPPTAKMWTDLQIDQMLVARSTVDYDTTYRPRETELYEDGIRVILIPNDLNQYDQMHLLFKQTTAGIESVRSISFTQTGEGVGVISINGRTGVLTLSDIGACPAINDEAATSTEPWSGEHTNDIIQESIEEALDGATIADILDSISALETSLETLDSTVSAYGTRIGTLEGTVASQGDSITSQGTRLSNAESAINTINSNINSIQSTISQHTTDISDTNAALEETEEAVEEIDQRVADIEAVMPSAEHPQVITYETTYNDAILISIAGQAFGTVAAILNVPDGYTIVGLPKFIIYHGNQDNPTSIVHGVYPVCITGGYNTSGSQQGRATINITVYNTALTSEACWAKFWFQCIYTGRDNATHPDPWPDPLPEPTP